MKSSYRDSESSQYYMLSYRMNRGGETLHDHLEIGSSRISKSRKRWYFRLFRFIKKLFLFTFITVLLFTSSVVLGLLYLRAQALPQITLQQTSQIVDSSGVWIDSFYHEQNRRVVPLSEISPWLIQATLAIEDHRFFQHFGIDFKSILRAVLINLEQGKMIQGAGTITQQLARNVYLSHERTWTRKIKETIYALQFELQYQKEDILEKYLNQIYYGHAAYGIETASQLIFGKRASELSLAESALVAGIPKGPRYYSPYHDLEKAKQRQSLVLQNMVRNQMISQRQADDAQKEPLEIKSLTDRKLAQAPYFRDYVKAQAMRVLGYSEEQLEQSGVKITTTLNLHVQRLAEEIINQQLQPHAELQVALISVNPQNGFIQAMVGGRDYELNQYNRVFTQSRQPGSSFKPILYLTGLQRGYTALTSYKSEPTVFTYDHGQKSYAPRNFDHKYFHEYIDMRKAIATSDNMYAVHTILDIGAEHVVEMAKKLGIQSTLKPLPSLALGACPISPYDMAQAYSVIANQGIRNEPIAILKIEDTHGQTLYTYSKKSQRVVDAPSAYVLTHLMQSVFAQGGSAHRVAHAIKRPIAGKTGSTNTDAWMVGFTPELATAVWIGYDKDRTLNAVESHLASPLFAEFTERALQSLPPQNFQQPEGVVKVNIDLISGKLSNPDCPQSRIEVFVIGTEPLESCTPNQAPGPPFEIPELPPQQENGSWWEDLLQWWTT